MSHAHRGRKPGGRNRGIGAFELAEQLGLPPPTTCPVRPAEAAKRKQLQSELETLLDAPLIERAR